MSNRKTRAVLGWVFFLTCPSDLSEVPHTHHPTWPDQHCLWKLGEGKAAFASSNESVCPPYHAIRT